MKVSREGRTWAQGTAEKERAQKRGSALFFFFFFLGKLDFFFHSPPDLGYLGNTLGLQFMAFSLSSLSSELVGAIADLLPSHALKVLLATGDLALRHRIRQGMMKLELEVAPLEVFPSWVFTLPQLLSPRR